MSPEVNELAKALASAQSEIAGAKMDSENPFFKAKYADLASVWEACRKPLTKNGLSIAQSTQDTEHGVKVITTLMHSSGQWITGEMTLKPEKQTPQTIGSCISYARRYALAAMVGVAQVDDDAEATKSKPQESSANNSANNFDKKSQGNPALFIVPFGNNRGKKLSDIPNKELLSLLDWCNSNKKTEIAQNITAFLATTDELPF